MWQSGRLCLLASRVTNNCQISWVAIFVLHLSEIRSVVWFVTSVLQKKRTRTVSDRSDETRSYIAIMFCPSGVTNRCTLGLDLSEISDTINPPRQFVPRIWQASGFFSFYLRLDRRDVEKKFQTAFWLAKMWQKQTTLFPLLENQWRWTLLTSLG